MEIAYPEQQRSLGTIYQFLLKQFGRYAMLHLRSGFFGECESKNPVRRNTMLFNDSNETLCKDGGLSRPRSRHHLERGIQPEFNGPALGVVRFEISLHQARTPRLLCR